MAFHLKKTVKFTCSLALLSKELKWSKFKLKATFSIKSTLFNTKNGKNF